MSSPFRILSFTALLVTHSDAFVNPSSSSFIPHTDVSINRGGAITTCPSPYPGGRVSVRMGLVPEGTLADRFIRVAKADMNKILKNVESPERIMNQAVEDMQADFQKISKAYSDASATQLRLVKQREQAKHSADHWYGRAQFALRMGNEQLAREALTWRQKKLENAKDLQDQIDSQRTNLDKLYEGMQTLEERILEAKAKKEQFIARARKAQSVQQAKDVHVEKMNNLLGGLNGLTSIDAYERMKEKVEALEAAAEASFHINGLDKMLPEFNGEELEQKFLLLEASASVENELNEMKKDLRDSQA